MATEFAIEQIEVYKLFIPLKEPFVISLGPVYNAENVIVVIRTNLGFTGFGECSPFMSINGESADTGLVVANYFGRYLKGKNPLNIPAHIAAMDRIIYGNSSIKSAFDMALYDIASQHAGVPLYEFLGGKKNKTIFTNYTVSLGDPDEMARQAVNIRDQGYPAIKVKLGKQGTIDVERIRAIRKAVGNEIPLRIDANQGWELEEAITTLKALAVFNIQHCEEPIARWAFMDLPLLKRESPIPIMCDESCSDDHDAERLIRLQACDYLNIKLGKSGGIFKGLKMVRLAEAANMHLQVGAFLESRLAMTAFAHFSLCSDLIGHYDFDTSLMFSEDPVAGGMIYRPKGVIELAEIPGIGASIAESWLGKMQRQII